MAAASSLKDSAPWTGWLLAAIAATVLLYGIDIFFHPITPTVSELLKKFALFSTLVGATVLCQLKSRVAREERAAWWLLALAIAL